VTSSIQTDSAITQQHLDEAAHKITSNGNKSKWPPGPSRRLTLLPLEMLNPTLVFGVVVPLTPIVVTAQHQMIFVTVVENAATGNKCAGLLLQGWSPVLLRIQTVTLSHPLTTSHMMYVKSHMHLRESVWNLTSVLLHSHHVLNGSDSRLTLAALKHYTCHRPQQALPCTSGPISCPPP